MKALARLPPERGIAAMQAINITVLNRWFLFLFLGTAACSLLLIVSSLLASQKTGSGYRLIGGGLYIVGALFVTRLFNIPRNDALAAVRSDTAEGAKQWADYLPGWTTWNHVRMTASLAAAIILMIALRR